MVRLMDRHIPFIILICTRAILFVFYRIFKLVANETVRIRLSPTVPLLVPHETFLAFGGSGEPSFKVICSALALFQGGEIDEDSCVFPITGSRLL